MCGICGYLSDKSILTEALREMNDTMYHRGLKVQSDLRSAGFLFLIFLCWDISQWHPTTGRS